MAEIISYSLRAGQANSDQYYDQISVLTDDVLRKATSVRPIVNDYMQFIQRIGHESLRTEAEYILDLLTLGTLWRCYLADALNLSKLVQQLLVFFWRLRQKKTWLKPVVDYLRGVLITLFITSRDRPVQVVSASQFNLEHWDKLIAWLKAAGDFEQEVNRLLPWRVFFLARSSEEVVKIIKEIINFADWFKEHSEKALGKYTSKVDKFLKGSLKKHQWAEDLLFCGRSRVLYHLGMFGAEIMNRAFRQDFLETKRKVVLVPICLRARDKDCQFTETSQGNVCIGCTKGCLVQQLTKHGEKHDFEVYIIFHQSSVFTKKYSTDQLGVIGIGCVHNLLSGGWEVKSLGHHPQCVILDYCGCKKHWHDTGIVTDINLDVFHRTLGVATF